MNFRKIAHVSALLASLLALPDAAAQNKLARPKLVVGIVVDQMRWDYLYRFYDRYGSGGFRRMLNEGFTCENTMINYVPAYTAIGHSTIYTGSVPSIHGIAANEFIVQATGKTLYCTEDSTVYGVGSGDRNAKSGKMSPFNLKATTITDELKLATNFRSKVIGVAIKDRGSILPAGHAADAAYWYDGASGNFITSTWYRNELPAWATAFNDKRLAEKYLKTDWNTLYPIDTYVQSAPDNNNYEELYANSTDGKFPIRTSELMKKNGLGLIATTPYGNTLTFDMAKAAVENEGMGQHPNTDFLAVSLSSPDYIGHQFGMNSVKIEDNYLRLDKDLADFLAYLDTKVGRGNYLLFLSADHGASHNGQFLLDHKIPAGNWNEKEVRTTLNEQLKAQFGHENMVLSLENYQVSFDYRHLTPDTDKNKLVQACIDFLQKLPQVAYAVETAKAGTASIPAVIKEKIINGYNRELSGEIQIILKPDWYGDNNLKGGTHGTWNPYDAHIPLVWMGWGIKHGQSNEQVYMTDIAPTLAALLHIQMPNGCIGKPILPVLGQ